MNVGGGHTPEGARPARRPWSDLGPRLISALILITITIAALYIGGFVFAAVVGAVFAGCYREWETMVALKSLNAVGWALTALVALSALVFPWLGPLGSLAAIALAVVLAAGFGGPGLLWRVVGLSFFGAVIVAALAMRGQGQLGILAGFYLGTIVWMTDSAAFFAGRQIGGEKLAPDISPSKTWSGALGGLALGTGSGLLLWIVLTDSPWWIGLILSLAISILGQVGDLSESAVKRRFRVKDSGDIIPGHGGLMDRLDSLTFGLIFMCVIGASRAGFDNVAAGFMMW